MGNGTQSYGDHVLGIQELLPPGGKYVGDWQIWSPPAVRMRKVFSFPPKKGLDVVRPGIRVSTKKIGSSGRMAEVEFSVTAADPHFIDELWNSTVVLTYSGKIHAFPRRQSDRKEIPAINLLPVTTLHFLGRFYSPVGQVWNQHSLDELLSDATVNFFCPDKSLPPITVANPVKPMESVKQPAPGLEGKVEVIFGALDFYTSRNDEELMAGRGKLLPREAMPFIMARHPWSDNAWDKLVRPFLLKWADDTDKENLLGRMEAEPRLGEIMVAKGWATDAMPLLRKFAAERLPLDVASLSALAQERDPALAKDLAAVSARLEGGVENLELLVRGNPGFDWQAFVHDGWMRRKYSFRLKGPVQPFNLWAAQEGNFSAFRYTAEQAARGSAAEVGQLRHLVSGDYDDLLGFLRQNIDTMVFDPAARRWKTP